MKRWFVELSITYRGDVDHIFRATSDKCLANDIVVPCGSDMVAELSMYRGCVAYPDISNVKNTAGTGILQWIAEGLHQDDLQQMWEQWSLMRSQGFWSMLDILESSPYCSGLGPGEYKGTLSVGTLGSSQHDCAHAMEHPGFPGSVWLHCRPAIPAGCNPEDWSSGIKSGCDWKIEKSEDGVITGYGF